MKRFSLALLIFCSSCAVAHAQSFAHKDGPRIIEDATADQVVAARAIFLLRRLDDDIIVYRSFRDFAEDGKLARVPLEKLQRDLLEITTEVRQLISRLPDTALRTDLINAFASYRDGVYWWEKIPATHVVCASDLSGAEKDNSSDEMFAGSIPYTVAIHWRMANEYLQRAIRDLGL